MSKAHRRELQFHTLLSSQKKQQPSIRSFFAAAPPPAPGEASAPATAHASTHRQPSSTDNDEDLISALYQAHRFASVGKEALPELGSKHFGDYFDPTRYGAQRLSATLLREILLPVLEKRTKVQVRISNLWVCKYLIYLLPLSHTSLAG